MVPRGYIWLCDWDCLLGALWTICSACKATLLTWPFKIHFSFCFEATTGNAQLFLALCPGISPSGLGGFYGVLGIKPGFDAQGKYLTLCTIVLTPQNIYLKDREETSLLNNICHIYNFNYKYFLQVVGKAGNKI